MAASEAEPGLLLRSCREAIRRADYDLARERCERAVVLSSASADAHYWYGVALGRWGESRGRLRAMFLVAPIRREMEAALRLDAGYGDAHRVLGELLWQIPALAGGDKKKALAEFEAAVRLSPRNTDNYRPLAEAYLYFDRRKDAAEVLRALQAAERLEGLEGKR